MPEDYITPDKSIKELEKGKYLSNRISKTK